jgi:hypothetical protein
VGAIFKIKQKGIRGSETRGGSPYWIPVQVKIQEGAFLKIGIRGAKIKTTKWPPPWTGVKTTVRGHYLERKKLKQRRECNKHEIVRHFDRRKNTKTIWAKIKIPTSKGRHIKNKYGINKHKMAAAIFDRI